MKPNYVPVTAIAVPCDKQILKIIKEKDDEQFENKQTSSNKHKIHHNKNSINQTAP